MFFFLTLSPSVVFKSPQNTFAPSVSFLPAHLVFFFLRAHLVLCLKALKTLGERVKKQDEGCEVGPKERDSVCVCVCEYVCVCVFVCVCVCEYCSLLSLESL